MTPNTPQTMSHTMSQNLVITALGNDSPGIANQLISHVSSCGCNIVDSKLAIFGNEFTLIMLVSGEWNAMMQIESSLPLKSQELDLITIMKRTEKHQPISYDYTIDVAVTIADAPGIIERFTKLFAHNQLNLASFRSQVNSNDNAADTLSADFILNGSKACDLVQLEADVAALSQSMNAEYQFSVEGKVA